MEDGVSRTGLDIDVHTGANRLVKGWFGVQLELEAAAAGYARKHYKVVPNANELVVRLTRPP
jgi:hypothetical protein